MQSKKRQTNVYVMFIWDSEDLISFALCLTSSTIIHDFDSKKKKRIGQRNRVKCVTIMHLLPLIIPIVSLCLIWCSVWDENTQRESLLRSLSHDQILIYISRHLDIVSYVHYNNAFNELCNHFYVEFGEW